MNRAVKVFFFFQIKFKFFLARDGAAAPFQPDPAHSNSVRVASGNSEFGTHSIPVTPRKKTTKQKTIVNLIKLNFIKMNEWRL